MPSLEGAVEAIRAACGADFAFVLTRRGRLVTRDAPKDMPESGRTQIVYAADRLVEDERPLTHVSMPREELVPFGGAAPVDVYVAVQDEAIVCLVLASWTDPSGVGQAMENGLPEVAEVLSKVPKRSRRRTAVRSGVLPSPEVSAIPKPPTERPPRKATERPPARASKTDRPSALPLKTDRPSPPPPLRVVTTAAARAPIVGTKGAMAGLVHLAGTMVSAAKSMQAEPQIQSTSDLPPAPRRGFESVPDIVIGTATLGRESLAAIEADQARLAAVLPAGRAGGSLPEIALGVTALGRASLSAIEVDAHGGVPRGDPNSSIPDVRVSLASMPAVSEEELQMARDAIVPGSDPRSDPDSRVTQPWTESAIDTKRFTEAARGARGVAAPKVSVRLTSLDEETALAVFEEEDALAPPESGVAEGRVSHDSGTRLALGAADGDDDPVTLKVAVGHGPPPLPPHGRRKHKSLDVWRDAIEKILDQEKDRKPPAESGEGPKLRR